MDFLNDKKNTAILTVVAVLVIGVMVASAVHFLGGPAPIDVSAYNASTASMQGNAARHPVPVLGQGGKIGQTTPQ